MHPTHDEYPVSIPITDAMLTGSLGLPPHTSGVVIFSHGSGSSRLSPRNTYVAQVLRQGGIGTLLFDLLTPEEDIEYERRFDIALLTRRLIEATFWVFQQPEMQGLPVGYFGASTGSASALNAAAELGDRIHAVVSRGGRPDLAADALSRVIAPTLLIVGGNDEGVLELNREAYEQIRAIKRLAIVPGATHLFEEFGALEAVARLATEWFRQYLGSAQQEAA